MQEFEEGDQIQNIQQQFTRFQFSVKKKQELQQEQLDNNTKKVEELEKKIVELQAQNDNKQKKIDDLVNSQKKLVNDFTMLWSQITKLGKIQKSELQLAQQNNSNLNSVMQFSQEQCFSQDEQTKSTFQKDIIEQLQILKTIYLKKSEFLTFERKIDEQFDFIKSKLNQYIPNIQQQNFQQKKDSAFAQQIKFQNGHQENKAYNTLIQFEKKEQIEILDTQYEKKLN